MSFDQLRALGLTSREIERRVEVGRLHRLHRGVYAVGHRGLGADGRRWAAVLALGDDAYLVTRAPPTRTDSAAADRR